MIATHIKFSRGLCTKKSDAKILPETEYIDLCKTVNDIFEYIPDDRPVKLYFDIDIKGDADAYDGQLKMTDRVVDMAKTVIIEWLKINKPGVSPQFCVSHSNSARFVDWKEKKEMWKVSLHIVVPNIVALKSAQKDIVCALNKFAIEYKSIEENMTFSYKDELMGIFDCDAPPKLFDESPYDKDRKLRAVGSSKPGENRPLELIEGELEQSVISGFIPDDAVEYVADAAAAPPKTAVATGAVGSHNNKETSFLKIKELIEYGIYDKLANDYTKWINVGFALYNTFTGEENGWILFDLFSRRCPKKYDELKNREWWEKSPGREGSKLTEGSIYYWAMEENKEAAEKIMKKYKDENYIDWNLNEASFAKMLHRKCFNDSVVFTGMGKEPNGYLYNGVYWEELSMSNAELMCKKFDELHAFYIRECEKYINNTISALNALPPDDYKGRMKELKKLRETKVKQIDTLQKYQTRRNIIKIFQTDNYVKNIEWNKNPNLFVFEDCVYDLEKGEIQEKTDPKDYVNISCGKKFHMGFTVDEIKAAMTELKQFFKGIVLPEDYEYLMKLLASFMKQENKDERGHFWLGAGRNGKGTISELVKNVLGNYWGELSMEYYTCHSKDKDRPNQNLYNCRNARVLNSSELADEGADGKSVSFISSVFKSITGGDAIYARELGTKNTAYFKAGKTLIQTNTLPRFSKIDVALKERIVIMEFPYIFVDDENKIRDEPEKYKKKNSALKDKFKGDLYRIALTHMLFNFYKKYLADFTIPASIKAYTASYFNSVNVVEFVRSNCSPDAGERVSFDELKQLIKTEFGKTITNKNLKAELEEEKLEVVINRGFYYLKGYKMIYEEEEWCGADDKTDVAI